MSISGELLDLIFPRRCLGCGALDTFLCSKCVNAHKKVQWQQLQQLPLDGILTLGPYANPFWRQAITTLKFKGVAELAKTFGELLARAGARHFEKITNPILVPVPLHRRRLRERGFNQSELIATMLARQLHWPIYPNLLQRRYYAAAQANQEATQRFDNVANIFKLNNKTATRFLAAGPRPTFIIVDDVITTGATILNAATVLGTLKPQKILTFAVARGR